jgi:hypothetical protein
MNLLSKPLTEAEIRNTLDMLEGNIARIRVSDSPEEIVCMLGFATSRLSMLAYSRIKGLGGNKEV